MPIHVIKNVLGLVPEVAGHVKKAYVEQDFPTHDLDSTIVSALEIAYLTKVAHVPVDIEDVARVSTAVKLYGVSDKVHEHVDNMCKQAVMTKTASQNVEDEVRQAEELIRSRASVPVGIEKVASQAAELYDNYTDLVTDKTVRLYACAGTLVKEAALAALKVRAERTGNQQFTKVAQIIEASDVEKFSVEDNRTVVNAILTLEKQANYFASDIFPEIFSMEKKAAMVDLGSKKVSPEAIIRLGADRVKTLVGSEVAKLVESHDAASLVAVINSLPLPEKQLLARAL